MSEVLTNPAQTDETDSSTCHRLMLGSSIVLLSACGVNLVHRPPLNLIMLGGGLLGMGAFQIVDLWKVKRLLRNLPGQPADSVTRSSLVCYLLTLGLSLGLLAAAGIMCYYRPPLNMILFSPGLIGLIGSMTLRLKTLK